MVADNNKVIAFDTKATRMIRGSNSDVRAIANIIMEHGAEMMTEHGAEEANIMLLVNVQLQRLLSGEDINHCLGCGTLLTMHDFMTDPLVMICCPQCAERAVLSAVEQITQTLRIEISDLNTKVKENRRNKNFDSRNSDLIDQANHQTPDYLEQIALNKKERLSRLEKVMREGFSMKCSRRDCEEDVPLPARIKSPEISVCRSCAN